MIHREAILWTNPCPKKLEHVARILLLQNAHHLNAFFVDTAMKRTYSANPRTVVRFDLAGAPIGVRLSSHYRKAPLRLLAVLIR